VNPLRVHFARMLLPLYVVPWLAARPVKQPLIDQGSFLPFF